MEDRLADFIRGLIILILGLAALAYVLIRWWRRSQDDPGALVVKWIVSAAVIVFLLVVLVPAIMGNGLVGAFFVPFVAAGGMILAILWTPNVVGWISQKFENLYTGGDVPPDPTPLYSIAEARRKRGQFQEAILEVKRQLEQFPNDVPGQLLLAEIQAQDVRDLVAAQETIHRFTDQPGHAPENIWLALNYLADWHLQYAQDIPSARQALERIIELLPDSPQAQRAAQRLAFLANPNQVMATRDRTPIPLKKGVENIGLMRDSASLRKPEEDPETVVAHLALHLEQHPQDHSAREHLALLFSSHYQDLSLAAEQLEFLIQAADQPWRHQVRLLTLLADLQVKHGQSYEVVCKTLQRIIDLNPQAASAAQARQRLDHLRLELKGKEKGRVIQLGKHE